MSVSQYLKKLFSSSIKDRMVVDYFKKREGRRVLISYITRPFREQSVAHSNYFEVTTAAEVFDNLGYVVDIMHYEGKIPNLIQYDVIYGFGDVFQKYFESGLKNKKTIYYGTGMHVCHQNTATLQRVKQVHEKKGIWLAKSARFVEKTWSHQTTLVDGIIALGNEHCAETYKKYYDGTVLSLPAPFFQTANPSNILENRSHRANKSYLWFGSAGLIHKGLDLCLEFFRSRPDLTLHICGNIEAENEFVQAYSQELFNSTNIQVHGFINIESEKFKKILKDCSFLVYPSCSEGGGVAVLTAIGNGALIPIISKESSVSTGAEIFINELTVTSLENSINLSQSLTATEIVDSQKRNLESVLGKNNQDMYRSNLKHAIKKILSYEM